eukprot:scaffold182169_cov21-Tisochrysis_lutea.AAC.1
MGATAAAGSDRYAAAAMQTAVRCTCKQGNPVHSLACCCLLCALFGDDINVDANLAHGWSAASDLHLSMHWLPCQHKTLTSNGMIADAALAHGIMSVAADLHLSMHWLPCQHKTRTSNGMIADAALAHGLSVATDVQLSMCWLAS